MKINNTLILLSSLLLTIVVSFDVNIFDYSRPVKHADYKLINFKDFKGLKKINQDLEGSNDFAFISTEIKIVDDSSVVAVFHPSRSYVYNDKSTGEKNLFLHEIYHFHIAEYFARSIRAEIAKSKKSDISGLLKKYKTLENEMQYDYDMETDHSYFMGKQLSWQQKIDSLLNNLKAYQ